MKERFTKFECDYCNEKIVIQNDAGFPYDKGWNYIHSFKGNASTNSTHRVTDTYVNFNENDKHFCSKSCLTNFVADTIKTEVAQPKIEKKQARHELPEPEIKQVPAKKVPVEQMVDDLASEITTGKVHQPLEYEEGDDEEFIAPVQPVKNEEKELKLNKTRRKSIFGRR